MCTQQEAVTVRVAEAVQDKEQVRRGPAGVDAHAMEHGRSWYRCDANQLVVAPRRLLTVCGAEVDELAPTSPGVHDGEGRVGKQARGTCEEDEDELKECGRRGGGQQC